MKMKAEGVDHNILDMNPDGPSPNSAPIEPTAVVTLLKDDPMFAKYFKMLAMVILTIFVVFCSPPLFLFLLACLCFSFVC